MSQGRMWAASSGLCAALSVCIGIFCDERCAADIPAKENIRSDWRRRAEAVETLRVQWRETVSLSKGAYSMSSPDGGILSFPDEQVEYEAEYSFVMDEKNRIRFERSEMSWSVKDQRMIRARSVEVFDGRVSRLFEPASGVGFPVGHVGEGRVFANPKDLHLIPILLYSRGLDDELSPMLPTADFELAGSRIDDAGTQQYTISFPQRGEVTVDTGRSSLPLVFREMFQGIPTITVSVSYSADPVLAWVPAAWTTHRLAGDGSVVEAIEAEVVSLQVNNGIGDGAFELQFDPGTFVMDNLTGTQAITLANGEERRILPGEFTGENYEELLSTPAGGAGLRRQGAWRQVILAANVAAILLFAGFLLYRRRTRRPHP